MDRIEFRNNIKYILAHISDAAYLENHGLFALLLPGETANQPEKLRLLRERIDSGIQILRPPEETPASAAEGRCYRILSMRYLQSKELYKIEEELGLSQRQVQRDLKKGVDALASILWSQLHPSAEEGTPQDGVEAGTSVPNDIAAIREELKNWEITFELVNLSGLIEQAVQLYESLPVTEHGHRMDHSGIDRKVEVMVDPVLTRQGLYKLLSVPGEDRDHSPIQLVSRKVNEFFLELSLQFHSGKRLTPDDWQVALVFFTIQGINHTLTTTRDLTTISLILPLVRQNCCLVIDDVVSVRRLVERMLASFGIQVFGADNLQDALNLAQLMKPGFILLDVLMPNMDGWQVLGHLQAHPETREIPVIICSVMNEPKLAKVKGAVASVRKPIERLELIRTLQSVGLIPAE